MHAQIIEALGTLAAHQDSLRTLRTILYRGEWWAPFRTAALRQAAAAALRGLGTPEATAVLQEAAAHGSRAVRKAARAPPAVLHAGSDMSAVQRARLADELVRRLAAAIRGAQLYSAGHPIVVRSVSALIESLEMLHASSPTLAIGIVGEDLVVGEIPVARAAENMGELMRRLQQAGVERIVVDRGVEAPEVTQLIQALAAADASQLAALAALRHIRVGRLQVEQPRRCADG